MEFGGTIKKEQFPSLLTAMLTSEGAVNNAKNIRAGFAACGIFPLRPKEVLKKLPPEQTLRSVQGEFDQVVLETLESRRYGDPTKATRAKKANRLPPGKAYTVSAVGDQAEPIEGKTNIIGT